MRSCPHHLLALNSAGATLAGVLAPSRKALMRADIKAIGSASLARGLATCLCRNLCRNPAIPAAVGLYRRVSLGYRCAAEDSDQSRMNIGSACSCVSLTLTQSFFGLRIRNEEASGSIPLRSTNPFNHLQASVAEKTAQTRFQLLR